MVVFHATVFLLIVVLSAIFLGRFFAKVVEVLAKYIVHLDLTIDTFGLFSVRGIKIRLKGQRTLVVECISLQTKWTYSNSKKLFTILFGKTEFIQDEQVHSTNSNHEVRKKQSSSFVVSHKDRIAQIINILCQYVAISFCDIGITLRISKERLIECHIKEGLELHANPTGKGLNCILSTNDVDTQITQQVDDDGSLDTLVKITVGVILEASLQPLEGFSSADIQITLKSIQAVINDSILSKVSKDSSTPTIEVDSPLELEERRSQGFLASKLWMTLSKAPKHGQIHIGKSCISFVNKEKRKLNLEVSQIASTFEQMKNDGSNAFDVSIVISGVTATGVNSCELCTLNRLRFSSKLYEHDAATQLSVSLCIESLHNNYVHNECMYWMEYLKSRLRERKITNQPQKRSSQGLAVQFPVKIDVEMIDCSTCLFLTHERADQPLCRAVLASLLLNADIPTKDCGTEIISQEIRLETRIENAYIYFDALKTLPESVDSEDVVSYTLPDNPALLPNTTNHVWGRTLAMGSCAVKCDVEVPSLNDKPINIEVKAEASCFAVEWSHQVCSSLLHLTKQFVNDIPKIASSGDNKDFQKPTKNKVCLKADVRLRSVNMFYLGARDAGADSFVLRTDMIVTALTTGRPVFLEIFGVRVSRMVGLKKVPYKCLLSGDLSNPCLTIPAITASFNKQKTLSCNVTLQDTLVEWSPTLHMALHDRIQEVTQDIATVKEILIQSKTTTKEEVPTLSDSEDSTHDDTITTETTQHKMIDITCDISMFKLHMDTSQTTSFGVQLAQSSVNLNGRDVNAAMKTAIVLFDERNTFTFEDVTLKRSMEVEEFKITRASYPNLTTNNNTTWVIAAQDTRVFFPYQFDFATSRSELVNIAKMLKTLHRKPRHQSYIEPLPPDLWLRFDNVAFEIEDDPFEVKLGVNYALLLDEAKHWNDRMETLQSRLNTIRMTPGNLLTVQKEIMLHKKLLEKNAELYIQRSKSFYNEFPMRKSLLLWEFKGLDLKVLADASYHGKSKTVEMMMKLNSESPFPDSEMEFSTLWCRTVKGTLESHCCKLRDYPQPIFTSKNLQVSGTFLAAEQAARDVAKYDSKIEVGKPWDDMVIQRSLTVLKYYYDLDFDVDTLELAWGVDTEPCLAMVNLAFEHLSKPSKDPSKPLPFYDKIRLLLHGRLHMNIKEWLMFFSAARNPYERTERMEVDWTNVDLQWTNGRVEILGDFDLQTRTASRYDDRQVLHFPAFKVCADMTWNCPGNANDHFNVMPFAPSKLPELAPNQAHDTYAAFRSQSLSLHVSLETAMDKSKTNNQGSPNVCLYSSTFRWFKKYQEVVLRYTSRPIKRGKYFKRTPPKKRPLGRHYKGVSLSLKFPELSVWYWASFSQLRGFELKCGQGSLHTQYTLALRSFDGELTRRVASEWTATKLHIQIKPITCHLYGIEQADGQVIGEEAVEVSSIDLEPTKYYFLTTESVEYSRQADKKHQGKIEENEPDSQSYNHQLVCHGSKGVWTLTNRRIIFGLFEAYTNAELLKKNLSADALKITIVEKKQILRRIIYFILIRIKDHKLMVFSHSTSHGGGFLLKRPPPWLPCVLFKSSPHGNGLKPSIPIPAKKSNAPESPDVSTMKPRSMSLLQKLVSEKDSKFTVFTEEGTVGVEPSETALQGVSLCSMDDVISHTWHIKLVNSQILLQDTETKGGVLVTAGTTTVLNRLHRPVWSKTELLNKKTWVGRLENLQYFATVSPEDSVNLNNIPWLDLSVITGRQAQEKGGFDIADLANIVGSGEAVGGVVTAVVGGATAGSDQHVPQLQRIVARCGCEFYFVNFSTELDPMAESMTPNAVPQSPAGIHYRVNRLPTVDTYTIRHKLLEISTNSSQYSMLIDIVNNVVLYTEPKKKEAIERLQRMTFRLQLSASEDQRGQILKQQNIVRSRQAEMRTLQRDLYELNLLRKQELDNQELTEAMVQLERDISNKKELLNSASTELKLLISAYKDFQMNINAPTPEKAPSARADPTKLAEVHFNHVSWQLNQADGQLEIADVTFRNFSYSKTTLSDATIEHRFEVPKFNVRNLLPNSIYKDALMQNTVSGQAQKDRAVMVRLYCRVKPPVAGIGIKEHFEVNVCPLSVNITHRLYNKIMVFFFPQRAHEYESDVTDVDLLYKGVVEHDEKDYGDDALFTADDLEDAQPKTGSLKRCPSTASSISSSSDTSLDSTKTSKKSLLTSHTDSSPASPTAKDKGKKKSTFYRSLEQHDDLEKMKERASKNHSFIYVKVTEVLLCVSYKGEKEKNITDVRNFNLTLPTLEYHNRTWTWHDLLIAMKKDCINVLVSQIIKEKLHLKGAHGSESKDAKGQPREEDKAKLLFGDRSKIEKKKSKRSLLGKLVKKTLHPKQSGLLQPDGAGPEPVNLEGEVYQPQSDDELEEDEAQEPQQET